MSWLAMALALFAGPSVRFTGEVVRGRPFTRTIGCGLVFRLAPQNSPAEGAGWVISIHPAGKPDDEFSLPTLPLRGDNPRYITTWYGKSAKEAVAFDRRELRFVLNGSDFAAVQKAMEKLYWPYGHSEAALDEAAATLDRLSRGRGELKITRAVAGEAIESLRFQVRLSVPCR